MTFGRAWISVSEQLLVDLLGLPKATRIVRADMNSSQFCLRLGLEGDHTLPAPEPGSATPEISLLIRLEEVNGIRRRFGSYSHAPANEWLIDERPIPDRQTLMTDDPARKRSGPVIQNQSSI